MATRASSDGPLVLSVLDRLIDLSVDKTYKGPITRRRESIRFFEDCVRRDLEWLLNSRIPLEPPHGPESDRSLYTFGLPDINSLSLNSPADRKLLTKAIKSAIEKFEPRIANPSVTLETANDSRVPRLLFVIKGLLRMEPNPEPVAFNTELDLSSGEYKLQGDSNA